MLKIRNMLIFLVLFFFILAVNISFSLPQCSFPNPTSTIYMTYDIPYSIYFYSPFNEKGTCVARILSENIYSEISSYLPSNMLFWFSFDEDTETSSYFFTGSTYYSPYLRLTKPSSCITTHPVKNNNGVRLSDVCDIYGADSDEFNTSLVKIENNQAKTIGMWIVPYDSSFNLLFRVENTTSWLKNYEVVLNSTCVTINRYNGTTNVSNQFCNSTLINFTQYRARFFTISINLTNLTARIFLDGMNIANMTLSPGSIYTNVNRFYIKSDYTLALDDLFVFNGTLTESDIAKLINYPSISRGLVGCWKLDEGTETTANDCSGLGNNGTLYYNATWTDGKFDKALQFDGTNAYVNFGNSSVFSFTNEMTVSVWFKTSTQVSGSKVLVAKHYSSTAGSFYVGVTGYDKVIFVLINETSERTDLTATANYYDDNWHHLVGTYDGNMMKLYYDGVLVANISKTGTIKQTTYNLALSKVWGASAQFNGTIDEVRVYNRALSEEEVKMLYEMKEGINTEYINGTFQASVNDTRVLFECSDYYGYQTYNSDNFSIENVCINVYNTSFNLINTTITIDNATSSVSTNENPACYNHLEMPNGNVTIRATSSIGGIETTRNIFLNVTNNTFSNLSLFFAPSLSCFVFETRNIIREPIPGALLNFYHAVNGTFRLITQEITDSSAQTAVCLPTAIPIRVEASATNYRPANFTYTLFEWTTQPIVLTLIPETLNATVREDPFGIMAVFEPRSQVVSPGTTINISILATSDAYFTGVAFYVINRTLGNNETIHEEICEDDRTCNFSFNLSNEAHRYDVVIIANMTHETSNRTFRYETFFVTTYSDTMLGSDFVERSGLGTDVWLFIWFILTAAIFGLSFRYIGMGAVASVIFMTLFGMYLGIIQLGYGLLILIFSVIVILLAG